MNGDVEVGFSSLEQLDDVMALIRQAFDKHSEESEA
jgi:predicted transport protein